MVLHFNTTGKEAHSKMHIQKHHLEIIVLAADDAEITAENIAGAADIPPYRARAMLKRIGIEKPTRAEALELVAKRSPSACILLANMHREKHEKHETLWKNMEAVSERMDVLEKRAKDAETTATKALAKNTPASKLPNLKPSYFGTSVYLRELAEWAGISVEALRAQMESLAYMHEEIEYYGEGPDDTLTLTVKGANAVAKALDLEKAE